MNVLLIHPNDSVHSIAPGRFEPLSLETLAATIPKHEVQILDLRIDRFIDLDRVIKSFEPKVIGLTVNNTIHVKNSWEILEYLDQINHGAKIIVGGHHPTMLPADFRKTYVDAIFYGWAEKSFPAYIEALSKNDSFHAIKGVEILDNGKTVIKNENQWDLKAPEIPYPRRDLITKYLRKYKNDMGYRTSLVNTTRGCPNKCSFCSVWKVTTGQFIMRDPEDVFHEIASLPDHIHQVFFADDNTFINVANSQKLAHLIFKSRIKKKYSGYCRSDTIVKHPNLMRAWKKIGLNNLCVGFEVTSDDKLDEVNKRNTVSNNEQAAIILNKIGIPFRPHFIINPSFDKKDFERIYSYVQKHNLKSPIFPILTPIPGSDNYEKNKNSIHLDYNYFDFAHSVVPTRLNPRDFYWSWIRLYQRSYSLKNNLLSYLKKKYALVTSDEKLSEKSYHINLMNLFRLKLFAIYLTIKLIRHYKMDEALRNSLPN